MKTGTITLKKLLVARLDFIIYSLAFFIPFFISHPQLLTGAVVNCLLFIAIQKFSYKKIVPVVVLPSLGAILNGVLFGPATIFLYYFLPFIWISNLILIWTFSKLLKKNYFLAVLSSSFLKALFLFAIANLYVNLRIVPKVFLTAMGAVQLITALSGGVFSYFILLKTKRHERS